MIGMLVAQRRDLRRVQASLQHSQQLMELATEAGGLGVWSRDVQTGQLWASEGLRAILGFDPHSGFHFDDVVARIHPLDRDRVIAALKHAEDAGSPLQIEYRVQRPDGSERWILARGRTLADPQKKDARRLGVILDITDRKRAEESLHQQQAFLRQVIDATPNFIFAKDRAGRFTLANQAVAEAYGVESADQLIGKTDADFNPNAKEVEFFRHMDNEVMDTLRERFIPEECLTDALGRVRWLQTVKRPLLDADGRANQVLGASTDITQRKHTEIELQEQRAELAHVGRISMMGELAASLVHELNQPLTAILSNAKAGLRFMAHDQVDLQELREVLQDIVEANNRAVDIISGMRALGRKEEGLVFGTLDLASLVCEVARLAHGDAVLKDVHVELKLDDAMAPIRGDRVQLQQVLLNILVNAFDAMKECRTSERQVTVHAQRFDSRLNVVEVSDQGPGLRGDAFDKIFQPFFTTKRDGLGMGLSICRSIIKAHGGSLWVENNSEGGATFFFTVPIATQTPVTHW
jgi:PAS domain S-box-containing protein